MNADVSGRPALAERPAPTMKRCLAAGMPQALARITRADKSRIDKLGEGLSARVIAGRPRYRGRLIGEERNRLVDPVRDPTTRR